MNGVQSGTSQVSVDGVNFQNLQNYRIQSKMFNVTFPQDNIFGGRPGPTQSVSDGWFIMLQPLTRSNGSYPYGYLELISELFGYQHNNTIEFAQI